MQRFSVNIQCGVNYCWWAKIGRGTGELVQNKPHCKFLGHSQGNTRRRDFETFLWTRFDGCDLGPRQAAYKAIHVVLAIYCGLKNATKTWYSTWKTQLLLILCIIFFHIFSLILFMYMCNWISWRCTLVTLYLNLWTPRSIPPPSWRHVRSEHMASASLMASPRSALHLDIVEGGGGGERYVVFLHSAVPWAWAAASVLPWW